MVETRLDNGWLGELLWRLDDRERNDYWYYRGRRKRVKLLKKDSPHRELIGQEPCPPGRAASGTCPACGGKRYKSVPGDWVECRDCGGTGKIVRGEGVSRVERMCPKCQGIGWVPGGE